MVDVALRSDEGIKGYSHHQVESDETTVTIADSAVLKSPIEVSD